MTGSFSANCAGAGLGRGGRLGCESLAIATDFCSAAWRSLCSSEQNRLPASCRSSGILFSHTKQDIGSSYRD